MSRPIVPICCNDCRAGQAWTKTGVHGDPTKATAEKGKILFEAAVSGLVQLVDELRGWPIAAPQDMHAHPVQSGIR